MSFELPDPQRDEDDRRLSDPAFASYRLEFVPQLIAAIERHEETDGNWATWNSVMIARCAVLGEDAAIEALGDACWQLDAEGRLPA